VTPTIVVYEVYRKLRRERGEQVALEAYAQMARTRIFSLDGTAALTAADTELKMNLTMADVIIYSAATSCGAELITGDEHPTR